MGIEAPAEVKFRLIHDAVCQDNNLLNISWMCRITGVPRSGYYDAWLNAAPIREKHEDHDREEFEKILDAYRFRGYAKGARGIHMRLLHTGTLMNLKKIRRLMRNYNLYVSGNNIVGILLNENSLES